MSGPTTGAGASPLAGQVFEHALPAKVDPNHFMRGTGGREPPREPENHHANQICHQNHIGPSCVRASWSRAEDRSLTGEPCAEPPNGPGVEF